MPARFFHKIFDPLAMGWGRTPVVWKWRSPRDDYDAIRLAVAKNFIPCWNRRFPRLSKLLYYYMLAVWPLRALLLVVRHLSRSGRKLKQAHGIGLSKQFFQLMHLALLHQVEPINYYRYGLYRPDQARVTGKYLTTLIQTALFDLINDCVSNDFTEDKFAFNGLLADNGLSVVETLAYLDYRQGVAEMSHQPPMLPDRNFVAKPNFGMAGNGVMSFKKLDGDTFRCSDACIRSAEEVQNLLIRLAGKEPYLLQPKLVNHQALADLTAGGLATARIITARSTEGKIQLVAAVLKMQAGDEVADNFELGGLASEIDLASGTIAAAVTKRGLGERHHLHPATGAGITGRRLPDWNQCSLLLQSAHRLLTVYAFLGWDVGFTDSGPVIIETNVLWSPGLIQQAQQRPLGTGEFARIGRQWLEYRDGRSRDTQPVIGNDADPVLSRKTTGRLQPSDKPQKELSEK